MRQRVALLALVAVAACHHPKKVVEKPITIPRATTAMRIDGQLLEDDWHHAFRSAPFVDSRGRPAPYTQLRMMGDDERLYVAIYVSDLDLVTRGARDGGDRVRLDVGSLELVVTPRGTIKSPGVQVAMDVDGTIDDSRDQDEEWVTELSIPWRALGGEGARDAGVEVRATRIDAYSSGSETALAWPRSEKVIVKLAPKKAS